MNYTKKQLGQYIDVLSGFAFKSKDFTNVCIPVIKIKNINPPYVHLKIFHVYLLVLPIKTPNTFLKEEMFLLL